MTVLLTWLTRVAQLQPQGLAVTDSTIKIITGGGAHSPAYSITSTARLTGSLSLIVGFLAGLAGCSCAEQG